MLDWLNKIGHKPDHPMKSVGAAKKLLSDLSREPVKALEEIASWLGTVTATPGYRTADRFAIVKLLDQTGRPFVPKVVHFYLGPGTLKEFERLHAWQVALEFWERLADAYRQCRAEAQQASKLAQAFGAELPNLIARELRAHTEQMCLLDLRYLPVRAGIWDNLFDAYRLAESAGCDVQRLRAYAADTLQTTPRQEFLRALMLDAASPESMLANQVELAARIAGRYSEAFSFSVKPRADCNWAIDLDHPHRPLHVTGVMVVKASARFFGAGVVISRMEEIIDRLAENPDQEERRFGDDFTPQDKFLVLKHLKVHWGAQPPHRREARHNVRGELFVARGYKDASNLVPRIEFGGMAELTRDMDVKLKEKLGLNLEATTIDISTEKWVEQNASKWGLGVDIPRTSERWVKIGALCALKGDAPDWWVGAVRRLYRDSENREHAGIEILAKKPVSVWLRGIGKGVARADNWASSSGSYQFDYLNVMLLGECAASVQRPELLLGNGHFHAGNIYEVMMGETPPSLQFEELLEQGEDYDRVRFSWITGTAQAKRD